MLRPPAGRITLGAAVVLAAECVLGGAGDAHPASAGPQQRAACVPSPARPVTAAPKGRRAATHSPLYGTGAFCVPECRSFDHTAEEFEHAKEFLKEARACLTAGWGRQFAAAGLGFRPPRTRFWREGGRRLPCGWLGGTVAGLYCPRTATLHMSVLGRALGTGEDGEGRGGEGPVAEPGRLDLFLLFAHEYAHHVQYAARIGAYAESVLGAAAHGASRNRVVRRMELQAECLAVAFATAIRPAFGLGASGWRRVMADREELVDRKSRATHGGNASRRRWLAAGARAAGPGGCDTWTAPARHVTA